MFKEKLAVIIPTKDRPLELTRLLESILSQTIKPVQVVVVDGGGVPVDKLLKKFSTLNINYLRSVPASLTTQRNAGIRAVCEEATLYAFMDDDIVLERDSINNMVAFWQTASEKTGGAAFNLTNEPYKKPSLMERIFLVNAKKSSRVLRSGFQSKLAYLDETRPVEWLVGCAMVWRKDIFKEFMFDECFSGYARYEDVEFSYRVGKKYKLFIVADAKVQHLNKPEDINSSFSLGKMEVINRLYLVKKNSELSTPLCYWALSGVLLNNFFKGLLGADKRYARRASGNLAGLYTNIFRKQITGPELQ